MSWISIQFFSIPFDSFQPLSESGLLPTHCMIIWGIIPEWLQCFPTIQPELHRVYDLSQLSAGLSCWSWASEILAGCRRLGWVEQHSWLGAWLSVGEILSLRGQANGYPTQQHIPAPSTSPFNYPWSRHRGHLLLHVKTTGISQELWVILHN